MRKFVFTFLMFLTVSIIAYSQSSGFKIVTTNPDFKIKVTNCYEKNGSVFITMIWENTSDDDVEVSIMNTSYGASKAYDDQMKKYESGNIKTQLANYSLDAPSVSEILPAHLPLKATIRIDGVSEKATQIKRLDLQVYSDVFMGNNSLVQFFNMPIRRR